MIMLFLAVLAAAALLVALPASFLMVLWNAVIYEGFKGTEINFYQGTLLWGAMAVILKLVFKPEIKFQIQPVNNKRNSKANTMAIKSEAGSTSEEAPTVEPITKLDKQN